MKEICVFHSWAFHKSQYHSTSIGSSEVNFITLTLFQKIEIAKNNFSEIKYLHAVPHSLGEFDTGRFTVYIHGCQKDQELVLFSQKATQGEQEWGTHCRYEFPHQGDVSKRGKAGY